jgi:hypothetical protein
MRKELAGNSVAASCFAAVLLAVLTCMPTTAIHKVDNAAKQNPEDDPDSKQDEEVMQCVM